MKTDNASVPVPGEILRNEEFEEPCNPENMGHAIFSSVPLRRVLEKLDTYLAMGDCAGAEKHLAYWLNEADEARNDGAKLAILNEQISLYRETGKQEECLTAVTKALGLTDLSGEDRSASCAMTIINMANAYRFFGQSPKALLLYRAAADICDTALSPEDIRLAGLYNNMALALTDTGEYREAEELYRKALNVMRQREYGEPDMALTYLNMADLANAELGPEKAEKTVNEYLQKAESLLDTANLPKDVFYAYACAQSAPVFGYYGWFVTEKKLTDRAREIREGISGTLERGL